MLSVLVSILYVIVSDSWINWMLSHSKLYFWIADKATFLALINNARRSSSVSNLKNHSFVIPLQILFYEVNQLLLLYVIITIVKAWKYVINNLNYTIHKKVTLGFLPMRLFVKLLFCINDLFNSIAWKEKSIWKFLDSVTIEKLSPDFIISKIIIFLLRIFTPIFNSNLLI